MIHSLILNYFISHQSLGLALAFLAMIFEGDILLFTFGFMTSLGFFEIVNIFPFLFLGTVFGDTLWYLLGSRIQKFPPWFNFFFRHISAHVDRHLKEKTFRTLLVSKFTYGLYHLMLVRAGILKINFKKFIEMDIVASFIWIILIGGLGFASGAYFEMIKHYLKFAEVGLLFSLILFFLLERLARIDLGKKL